MYSLSGNPEAPSVGGMDKDVSATAASGAPLWSTFGEEPSWAKLFLTTRHQGAPVTSSNEARHYAAAAPIHSKVPYIVRSQIPLATSLNRLSTS